MIWVLALILNLEELPIGSGAVPGSPLNPGLNLKYCTLRSPSSPMTPPPPAKISTNFAARLANLNSQERLQVIVLLHLGEVGEQRSSPSEVRQQAEGALEQVRGIVQHYNGQFLAEGPSALGTIPVEISVAGIYHLAECDAVRSILENQSLQF
ncbi:MAG: hypothetical protein HC835_13715 [Oscillatoriales cyanobacterium RM2_1_1]|nr:hypothetical protein [Oscillatoriales cyanobacterium SM2_3_0]NJO46599.1 hypothetical protein [Oscillatoriales cyanobacterium RM2_1_1]